MFHDIRFPLPLSFGTTGGPVWRTEIARLASGHELRNSSNSQPVRRYNIGPAIKSEADAQVLLDFFMARRGPLAAFRFRDPLDHRLEDELIGIGDNSRAEFQIIKSYGDAAASQTRPITKPMDVTVKLDGEALTPSDYSVDVMTGLLSFLTPPEDGNNITVTGTFDVVVRFASEHIDLGLESFEAFNIPSLELVEVRHA